MPIGIIAYGKRLCKIHKCLINKKREKRYAWKNTYGGWRSSFFAAASAPNLPELILGAGAAAVGSVISDIDCGTSESSRRADQIIFVSETIIIGIAAVEAHWHLGLYQRLMSNSSVSRIVLACAAFLAVCAYGKKTPHRSFLHSFLAGGLLMSCVGIFLPMLVPYFGIAYASHLALDFLNHKGEQIFLSVPETVQPGNLYGIRTG